MFNPAIVKRLLLAFALSLACHQTADGCLFCEALANTLSDDLRESTACVIAAKASDDKTRDNSPSVTDDSEPLRHLQVQTRLKGPLPAGAKFTVNGSLDANAPLSQAASSNSPLYLIFAFGDDDDLQWDVPIPLSALAKRYLDVLPTIDAEGTERLAIFLPYLVAEDSLVADDAYNEFARASFAQIQSLAPQLDRQWVLSHLKAFLNDRDAAAHRVRLMWTLLCVCGQPEDVSLFEQIVSDPTLDRSSVGFDAAIGCYLMLVGPSGLQRVERDFLRSNDEQTVLAALNAIRFHAVETDRFETEQLAKSLHPLLSKATLAAHVIPDLARMQDWTAGPALLELLELADARHLRIPIVNYVRSCPQPQARDWLETCQRVAPEAVESSQRMFPKLR